ncbi:hypothetical protein LTR86_009363 [Recurvomyces mirabilis]|nr:hypothetical protein LTR86_009363 [Recurvomyces mirabilis]
MAQQRTLIKLAQDSEDVASGLHVFRDSLPRHANRVTGIIAGLFAISSSLRQLDTAEHDPRLEPSFYRIRQDVAMLLQSLQASINEVFGMFRRSRDRSRQMVWEDLEHKMNDEESFGLLERLGCYRDFLNAQLQTVTGAPPHGISELRRRITDLRYAQRLEAIRVDQPNIAGARTPRPRPPQPRPPPIPPFPAEFEVPLSPGTEFVYDFEDWDASRPRPPVPSPPQMSPIYTSSPSPTLSSSYTSYSNGPVVPETINHWVQQIYDGNNPGTRFRPACRLPEQSRCYGVTDQLALQHLAQDGFIQALELPFDRDGIRLRLYIRLHDSRSRVLVLGRDNVGRALYFCQPVANLKVIRNMSCLQLCRARTDGSYEPWAVLNFVLYERMVLFYCTFVAMKYQDRRGLPEQSLHDRLELEGQGGEILLFGGVVHHDNMQHALRLFRDSTSHVVRMEASAHRGSMQDVPIWTAFVTKYAYACDLDWAQYEGNGSMADNSSRLGTGCAEVHHLKDDLGKVAIISISLCSIISTKAAVA